MEEELATVTDPAVAARLQLILIRSLMNRADAAAALTVIERTAAIAGLPAASVRQLEGTRAWLLILAGQGLPAAELEAMVARFAAAGDEDAQANLLASVACTAFLAGRPEAALDDMRAREAFLPGTDGFRSRSSSLSLPAMFELAASGPAAARAELDRARGLAVAGQAEWVDPFLGFTAGGIAFAAGDGRRGCGTGCGTGAGGGDRHRLDLRSSCTCSSSPRTTRTASPMSPLKLPSATELAGSPASFPWQDRACRVGLASPHD